MTGGLSGWIPLLAGVAGAMSTVPVLARIDSRRARKNVAPDISLQTAIEHALKQNPSISVSRLGAEMNVLRGIHKLACSGNISVFGSSEEDEPPAIIDRRTIGKLAPVDLVLTQSQEAPEGHVYALSSGKTVYRNLMVRSKELYQLWPKVKQ